MTAPRPPLHPATQLTSTTQSAATALAWLTGTGLPADEAHLLLRAAYDRQGHEQARVPWAHRVLWEGGHTGAWGMWRPACYTVTTPHPRISADDTLLAAHVADAIDRVGGWYPDMGYDDVADLAASLMARVPQVRAAAYGYTLDGDRARLDGVVREALLL